MRLYKLETYLRPLLPLFTLLILVKPWKRNILDQSVFNPFNLECNKEGVSRGTNLFFFGATPAKPKRLGKIKELSMSFIVKF